MIELKTPQEIKEMRAAGAFVGQILEHLKETTTVGTNLLDIDNYVKEQIEARPMPSPAMWITLPISVPSFRPLHLRVRQ